MEKQLPPGVKEKVQAQIAELAKQPKEKIRHGYLAMLQQYVRGWRPIFAVAGRNVNGKDIEEFRRREYVYRHEFEQRLKQLERAVDRVDDEAAEDMDGLIESWVHDTYDILDRGSRSIVVPRTITS